MPYTICAGCEFEQLTPKELVGPGLTTRCESCGAHYLTLEPVQTDANDAPTIVGAKDLRNSVLLLGGLIILVVAVLGGIIWLSKSKERAAAEALKLPASIEKVDDSKGTKANGNNRAKGGGGGKGKDGDPNPEGDWEKQRAISESKQSEASSAARKSMEAANEAAEFVYDTIITIVGFILIVVYLGAILASGVWIAGDSTARGANGLHWAAFYFAFQVLARVASRMMFAMFFGRPTFFLLVVGEIFAWCSLGVYLAARRGGSLSPCDRCNQKRLSYLTSCPYCKASRK